jgi:protein SPA2
MKPSPRSRAPSPTPTAFSGISNYRTDSYRPIRDKNAPPSVPSIDYRQVSKVHFAELNRALQAYLAKCMRSVDISSYVHICQLLLTLGPLRGRSSPVSRYNSFMNCQPTSMTSLYGERRTRKVRLFLPLTFPISGSVPFLPVREDFHPKRNQARQKLATLPLSRFEDLSSDVYFELARRYPEFKEDVRVTIPVGP